MFVPQESAAPSDAKLFRAYAPPQGLCENLTSALKLLASQQTRGDSFVDTIFQGFAGAEQDENHE